MKTKLEKAIFETMAKIPITGKEFSILTQMTQEY